MPHPSVEPIFTTGNKLGRLQSEQNSQKSSMTTAQHQMISSAF